MRISAFLGVALMGLTACGSESADGRYQTADDEIAEAQIDSDTKASIDSLAKNTRKGNIVFPIPDTLTDLLSRHHPQAQLPALPDQVMNDKRLQIDNPLYLTGDFNGDKKADYAVQVLQNDSIYVLAILDYAQQAQIMNVASYPTVELAGGQYSMYKLKLAPKDSVVTDNRNQKMKPLAKDGITVVQETRNLLYLLQNGRFIPFDQQK